MKRRFIKWIFVVIILIWLIIHIILNIKLKAIRKEIIAKADAYVMENNLLPTLNGTQITINLNVIGSSGTITYTKYNDEIVKTIENNNFKKFKKEKDKYNKNKNTKVNVYFNYYIRTTYNSRYTDYLPKDSQILLDIPHDAEIIEYINDDKTYYSYRDKKWKWYKNDVTYSDYSATKPLGFTYKDEATKTYSAKSKWSLDFPEEYPYRHIEAKTGYTWYRIENNEKVYWNHGAYSIAQPHENYIKDQSATMYSYYDEMFRWYNDNKRIYSYYSSVKPVNYNYKDDETLIYTEWSNYSDVKPQKEEYREIKEEIYTRYAAKYNMYSKAILNNPVSLAELEKIFNKPYQEIVNDANIKIEVIFKFQEA